MILTDYKFDWLKAVPKSWKADKVKNYFYISSKQVDDFYNYQILSLTMKGVKEKNLDSNEGQIAESYEKYNLVDSSTLVFNPMDLISGWVDIPTNQGLISPSYIAIKPKSKDVNLNFIKYYFQSMYREKVLFNFGEGVHYDYRWGLGKEALKNFLIPIPPIDYQNKVVTYLDKRIEKINLIENKSTQAINLLKEEILLLIEEIILDEDIERVRIENVANLVDRPINKNELESYSKIGMYNWGKGIFKYPKEFGDELGDSKFKYIREGDLLLSGQFSWEGSVSIVQKQFHNCIASHRFHIINGNKEAVLNEYLWSYFISQEGHWLLNMNSFGSGGRNRPLNIQRLLKEKIPIPSLNMQTKIKKLVHEYLIYKQYSETRTKLLNNYKESLISEIVLGKKLMGK
jgi:type I restriction enzyme, S subunit